MGLFSRSKPDPGVTQRDSSVMAYAWQLAPNESREYLSGVDTEALEAILEGSGNPNKNQRVPVALTAVADMSIAVHWDGRLVGHLDGLEAVPYVRGLRFLQQTGRFGVVMMEVPSRKSKNYGQPYLMTPYTGREYVPFNQPPEGYDVLVDLYPTVKNERFHAGDLQRIAPADGTPGWFMLEPQPDGEVLVYAPQYGRPGLGLKVGAIIKADLPALNEKLDAKTVAAFGRVYWSRGLDISLGI